MGFFIFFLTTLGLTNLVVNASILDKPRELVKAIMDFVIKDFGTGLLTCMMCSGFWVGIICYYLAPVEGVSLISSGAISSLIGGIMGRAFYLSDLVSDFINAKFEN